MSVCVLLHPSLCLPGCPPCWRPFHSSRPSPVCLCSTGLWVQLRERSWKKFLARRMSSWNVTGWTRPRQRLQVNWKHFNRFDNYGFPRYWSGKVRCYWECDDWKAFNHYVLSFDPFFFNFKHILKSKMLSHKWLYEKRGFFIINLKHGKFNFN